MSNRHTKNHSPQRRKFNQKPKLTTAEQLVQKRRLLASTRMRNLASATRHLSGLEQLYTEGLVANERGRKKQRIIVKPNLAHAEAAKRARRETVWLAESLSNRAKHG